MAARGSLPAPNTVDWGYPIVGHVEVVGTAHSTPSVRRLVKSVVQGMRACQDPEASSEGLGGTYFFMNEQGEKVAIMKPCDEEPMAPNNPKVSTLLQVLVKGIEPKLEFLSLGYRAPSNACVSHV